MDEQRKQDGIIRPYRNESKETTEIVEGKIGGALQFALNIPLNRFDFRGMSINDIIYVITNNKMGGYLADNPNKDYLLQLAKESVELTKACFNNCFPADKYWYTYKEFDLSDFLKSILKNCPAFEIDISLLDDLSKLFVICNCLEIGNYDFVSKNISLIEPFNLLNKYNSRLVLELLLMNNIKISEDFINSVLEYDNYNRDGLSILLKYKVPLSENIINKLLSDREAIPVLIKHGMYFEKIIRFPEEWLVDYDRNLSKYIIDAILEKNPSLLSVAKERINCDVKYASIIFKYDPMFLLMVDENVAKGVLRSMIGYSDLQLLEKSGIINQLINKYGFYFWSYVHGIIVDGNIKMIEEQIRNNPDLLKGMEGDILFKIEDLIIDIVNFDPSKMLLIDSEFLQKSSARFFSIAKNNRSIAKYMIDMGMCKVLQFLSKKNLLELLPYAYETNSEFKGIPSLAYTDREIMEIVKKYRPSIIKYDVVNKVNNIYAWAKNELSTRLREYFGDLLVGKDLTFLNEVTLFEESYMFDPGDERNGAYGYCNLVTGTIHVLVTDSSSDERSTVIHEAIHRIFSSKDSKFTGFNSGPGYVYLGLNEAATELFCRHIRGDEYLNPYRCAYYEATLCLEELLGMNIPGLDLESFKNSYAKNDFSPVMIAIDNIGGEGFCQNRLLPAFNRAIYSIQFEKRDISVLQKVLADLAVLKTQKEITLDNFPKAKN